MVSSNPSSVRDGAVSAEHGSAGLKDRTQTVSFFDPDAANHHVDILGAVQRVLSSRRYVLGQSVSAFERAFARFVGVADCAGVGNGTDALELALRALRIGPTSRVAMVANAAFYGSAAAHAVGATPVYVDVEPETANMAPAALATALEAQSLACILVTHLYGRVADMPAIMKLAEKYAVPVIEDCAQAHGAELGGRRTGTWGTVATFSFYPTKNLGALGDGGAVVSRDPELVTRVRSLRQYGWGQKYQIEQVGGRNSRLDEIQAAILLEKLPGLEAANDRRRAIGQTYRLKLAHLPLAPLFPSDGSSVGHLFVVRTVSRDLLAERLSQKGVQTAVHYPFADHLQPAYPLLQVGSLPVTESLCGSVLSLPCHPGLSEDSVEHVAAALNACFAEPGRLLS